MLEKLEDMYSIKPAILLLLIMLDKLLQVYKKEHMKDLTLWYYNRKTGNSQNIQLQENRFF